MYIVIEGQDGAGKDTQAARLVEHFARAGKRVVTYSESGTGSQDAFVAEVARLAYGSQQDIDHRTRVMLYLVNRYEQWRKVAEPALRDGAVVIVTRNWFSTLVYEGYGAGVSRSLIARLHKAVMPERYFKPDKIFILTVSEEEQMRRLGTQAAAHPGREKEVWKSRGVEFQHKLNAGYLKIAEEYKVPVIDGGGSIEEVAERILKLVSTGSDS